MGVAMKPLGVEGLRQFQLLHTDAVTTVTERFYAAHGPAYEHFGARGREACREDIASHLQFLRPVLEFGLACCSQWWITCVGWPTYSPHGAFRRTT